MKEVSLIENIQKSIEGDKLAFKTIMEEYADYVYRSALRIIHSEDDAKDIVQETFIRIWKNLERYNSKIKFSTWVYKIMLNLCLDQLRKKKRRREIAVDGSDIIKQILSEDDPAGKLNRKGVMAILLKFSENLSDKQRTIFLMQDIQQMSPDEISTVTGMSKGRIKSNIYYARKEIKKQLIKIGYEL